MNEHDKARPVSGEIMTGDGDRGGAPARSGFTEAEIVSERPTQPQMPRPAGAEPAMEGMDLLKAHSAPVAAVRNPVHGGPLFWTTGLALVALAFWISGGHALVRHTMVPAAVERGEPLRFGEIRSRIETRDGRDILLIEGEARNHGDAAVAMRPIEISVVDGDGRATRYFLGTRAAELAPGSRYSFSSRIEAPRNGVKSVSLSFQEGSQ